MAQVTQEETSVVAAGRTDAGVHALGQVVHLDTGSALDLSTFCGRLTRCCRTMWPSGTSRRLAADFHARYWAPPARHYRYRTQPVRSPLERRTAAHVAKRLDVAAMQSAAKLLVGEHDFASFGGKMWAGGTTRRTVHRLTVSRQGDWFTSRSPPTPTCLAWSGPSPGV